MFPLIRARTVHVSLKQGVVTYISTDGHVSSDRGAVNDLVSSNHLSDVVVENCETASGGPSRYSTLGRRLREEAIVGWVGWGGSGG